MLDGKRRWAAKAGVRTEISAIVNVPRRTMPHSLAGEREGNLTLAKKARGQARASIYIINLLAIHALDRTLPPTGLGAYTVGLASYIN